MAADKGCAECGAEFGFFTWKHACFRCGEFYCAKHFIDAPAEEATRRFGATLRAAENGEGVCLRCDKHRVTDVKDGWRDPIAVGDELCLLPRSGTTSVMMPLLFRKAAERPLEENVCHILIPLQPWDTAMWLLVEDAARARNLVGGEAAVDAWGKLFAADIEGPPPGAAETQSEAVARMAKFAEIVLAWQRSNWRSADIDDRLAWLQTLHAGVPLASTAGQIAQMSRDVVAAQVEPAPDGSGAALAAAFGAARLVGSTLLRTAFPLLGAALGAASLLMWLAEEDPPIRKLLAKIERAGHEKDLEAARQAVRAAALELDRTARDKGLKSGNHRSLYHAALAGLLMWLADGRRVALADAADCADPVPLAVAIAGTQLRSTEPLQRFLATRRGEHTEFPWDELVRRLTQAVTDADHWTRRPIGKLQCGQRLSRGATKEVFTLVDRDDVVVAIQLPRQAASVRREVDLLLDLARQTGEVGVYLGLQQVIQAGFWQDGDKKRIAFLTPRLFDRPKQRAWPAAATAVEAGVSVGRTLQVLHRLRFVHGDVKPANILWAEAGNAVLIDYGGAIKLTTDDSAIAVSRTDAFAAPEVCESGRITAASDVFALARTVTQWLAESKDAPTRVDAAEHHRALLDCLENAERREPKARPTLDRFVAVLEDWLVQQRQPKTRLTTVEEAVRLQSQTIIARWRTRPCEIAVAELQRAIRTAVLPPTGQADDHFKVVAQQWADFARTLVREELWSPWASAARQSASHSRVIECLRAADGVGQEVAAVVRGVVDFLEGQSEVMPQVLLTQTAVFLTHAGYRPLQDSILVWLNGRGPVADLRALAKLLRKIGALRNELQHGPKGQKCAYGQVVGGVVLLSAADVDEVRGDVTELGAVILGKAEGLSSAVNT